MIQDHSQTTQQLVDVEAIRDGVIILKSGELRAVLMCSSVNLALKSQDEQDALVYQYQNFLNGLDFPIQFVAHSRKLDITDYINSLKETLKTQENELLRIQTEEYIEFIQNFVAMQNIMSKSFYVIIPYHIGSGGTPSLASRLFGSLGNKPFVKMTDEEFQKHKNQLWQRVENVISGLRTFSIRSLPLDNNELMELFFDLYNPGDTGKQFLIQVGEGNIKMRAMTPREYARLQGVPDSYKISINGVQALTGFGDAVCVPAISWIAKNILHPLAEKILLHPVSFLLHERQSQTR